MEKWRARLTVLRLRQGYSSRHKSFVSALESVSRGDKTGNIATEMAYLESVLVIADACYNALIAQERLYVNMRYKDGLEIVDMARRLGLSRSGVYRLRKKVLVKCHDIVKRTFTM